MMQNRTSDMMVTTEHKTIRCSKCFVTLERLKEDQITDFLIKIVDENGKEKLVCPTCLNGW